MQILIIDNNIDPDSWGAPELCEISRVAAGATIRVRRAPAADLPRDPRRFDRIVISGSKTAANEQAPWIEQLDGFIRRAIDAGLPMLGVCYGHQAIARAIGGVQIVRRAPRGEFGWCKIERTENQSRLLRGLPKTFHTFQWHQDEVTRLPPSFRLLARSAVCPIQACELEGRPVYGVQFHPERGLEAGERALIKRAHTVPSAECVNRGKGPQLFDAQVGAAIFRNFLTPESL